MSEQTIKLVFAADHAGYDTKNHLRDMAAGHGYAIADVGAHTADRADYPDYSHQAAAMVMAGQADLGIFVCGSGTGMAISANKTTGIRAANCWKPEIAKLAREHNNANVLCIPARFVSLAEAEAILNAFLESEFEGGRHSERVQKIER